MFDIVKYFVYKMQNSSRRFLGLAKSGKGIHEGVIPIQRIRLVDEATRMVRNAILGGKLEPGTRLRQAELANQLGISRTPLREALMKLDQTAR
jgi:hypothetical protein